jgi:hypothetical protein
MFVIKEVTLEQIKNNPILKRSFRRKFNDLIKFLNDKLIPNITTDYIIETMIAKGSWESGKYIYTYKKEFQWRVDRKDTTYVR